MKGNKMFLILLICLCFTTTTSLLADTLSTHPYDKIEDKWIFEPAVTFNPAIPFFGCVDAGVSVKVVRDFPGFIDAVAYSSLSSSVFVADSTMRFNLTTNYNLKFNELIGVEINLGKLQSISLLFGTNIHFFQETLNNHEAGLDNEVYTSPVLITFNWGIMHSSLIPLGNGKMLAIKYFLPTLFSRSPLENVFMSSYEVGMQFEF